jgi:transglutaminase-like putative cysteine protease
MSNVRIHIQWQHKAASLLMTALMLSGAVHAQLSLKRQKYESIAARYANEHSVYTSLHHKLLIKEQQGQLLASSSVENEQLFISEKSLNVYNIGLKYSVSNFSYYTDIDGTILKPEGNDYKVSKSGSLAYTGLTKKSITRTTYNIAHEDLKFLPWYFVSHNIPVVSSELEVVAPKYVKMGFMVKGDDTTFIKRSIEEKDGNIIYRFSSTDVPAEKKYEGVPSSLHYKLHIIPYIISYRLTGAKRDSLMAGSTDVHSMYQYRLVKGLNTKTDSLLNAKTAELTRNTYSDLEKVRRIYEWVQNSFRYENIFLDDREGIVPNPADTVCKRMYGDCKDMSSILMAMCSKAGVNAYFVDIGTDNKPYSHEEMQSSYLYDHMICAVKLDGEWVFLDGTTNVLPLGANRVDLQGKEALIMIDDKNHKVVKVPEAPSSQNVITDNTVMNLTYNDISGTTYQHFTGYTAWNNAEVLAYKNRKEEKDEFARSLAMRGNPNFVVSHYDINASKSGNKDLSMSTNYTMKNYVQRVKKDVFMNMNVKTTFSENQVNDLNRKIPVYLEYKRIIKETVTLNVPKGHRVTYLPKPAKGGVDGLWSYNISYKADTKNNTVTLTKEYELKTMSIKPEQFAANNKLVDELNQQYKETVVLTAK